MAQPTLYTDMGTNGNDIAYLSDLGGLLNAILQKTNGQIDPNALTKIKWLLESVQIGTDGKVSGLAIDKPVSINNTMTANTVIATGGATVSNLP